MNYTQRRQKAVRLLSDLGLDALVFCKTENLRYLCGFSGSSGALLLTSEQLVFLTDSRYTTQSNEEVSADRIVEYKVQADGVVDELTKLGVMNIGFEAELAFSIVRDFQTKGKDDWNWHHYKDELHTLRQHKSEHEVSLIDNATDLNVAAFAAIDEMIKPGISEKDIALALEFSLRKLGAEDKAFDIIVASGPRGALPHGIASDKLLIEGELVTIDFGCRLAGYHSDETVTLALGDVNSELLSIYETVLEAHDRAIAAVSPGVALKELDQIARDYINDCGYGDFFGHGLGHGVGLEVHEAPTLSPRSTDFAEEGMVVTIEPGIYVPGVGGVRIEDMVLVTGVGHRVLTKIPKTFRNILLN